MKVIEIKTLIENLESDLITLGVSPDRIRIAHSSTDFGNSSYLYVSRFKIRCSDHSTGMARIM